MASKNKFGKRHYLDLARIMHAHEPSDPSSAQYMLWDVLVEDMCDFFQKENPRFRSLAFKAACKGVGVRFYNTKETVPQAVKEAAE